MLVNLKATIVVFGFQTLEVIPAADHFQIDVEVIVSLPTARQWLHGCGGQWIVIVGRGRHTEFCGIGPE